MSMSRDAFGRWSFSRLGLLLALAGLVSGALAGCSAEKPSLASTGEQVLAEDAQPGSSAAGDLDEDLRLPFLVPAFGAGPRASGCKFTDDPYNTCI